MIQCLYCNTKTNNPKFCSKSCSASYNGSKRAPRSPESRAKTSISVRSRPKNIIKFTPISMCCTCEKWFQRMPGCFPKTCSKKCYTELRSKIGKKSAASRTIRSVDEVKLFDLCKSQFRLVTHNDPIFNGWDADILIHDTKTAILWNGPWHYKEMSGLKHSLKQVQNRDRIKKNEIESAGWVCMIFEDRYFTPYDAFLLIKRMPL